MGGLPDKDAKERNLPADEFARSKRERVEDRKYAIAFSPVALSFATDQQ